MRRWTIQEAAGALRRGEISPLELVEGCLERIRRYDRQVQAWVLVVEAAARQAAQTAYQELQQGLDRGPLHGIPVGIKDIFDVAGWPTKAGSPLREGHRAEQDAPLVAALRRAGAILLGKTVTVEFACFDPSPTRNPWSPTLSHTPGGSSSGSAAAVAMGMCLGALGTQTGGSLVRPAAYCGIATLKPTFGQLPLEGVVPVSRHLDHAGPMALCVEDLWLMYQVLRAVVAGDHPQAKEQLQPGWTQKLLFPAPAEPVQPSLFAGWARVRSGEPGWQEPAQWQRNKEKEEGSWEELFPAQAGGQRASSEESAPVPAGGKEGRLEEPSSVPRGGRVLRSEEASPAQGTGGLGWPEESGPSVQWRWAWGLTERHRPPRLAQVRGFFAEQADPTIRKLFEQALSRLAEAGAEIGRWDWPAEFADVLDLHTQIMAVEAAAYHRPTFLQHREQYGPKITELLDLGLRIVGVDYVTGLDRLLTLRRQAADWLGDWDALIMPSTATTAPPTLETTGDKTMQAPWSCAGLPVVAIPCGLAEDGMPGGVQLIGPPHQEEALLAVAAWCEKQFAFRVAPPLLER